MPSGGGGVSVGSARPLAWEKEKLREKSLSREGTTHPRERRQERAGSWRGSGPRRELPPPSAGEARPVRQSVASARCGPDRSLRPLRLRPSPSAVRADSGLPARPGRHFPHGGGGFERTLKINKFSSVASGRAGFPPAAGRRTRDPPPPRLRLANRRMDLLSLSQPPPLFCLSPGSGAKMPSFGFSAALSTQE